jgi:murein DD-endopeptidase MepM/ murein hydrolase activator NlpD
MLETPSGGAADARGETIVTEQRGLERVKVVVERGDGSRVVRFTASRWMVSVAVGALGLALVVGGAWYRDYSSLRNQRAEFTALQTRLAEQRRTFDAFQERVAQIRHEVDSWRALHDRIWQPFGPDTGQDRRGSAVGGRSTTAPPVIDEPSAGTVEELERLAAVVGEEALSLRALERYLGKVGRALGALPSRWPVRGPVNSEFGRRSSPWLDDAMEVHSGIDIGAPRGTPVIAPAPGTVVYAGSHAEYGVTLIIDHGNDIKTLYGHLTRVGVAAEQKVERGQVMAYTGNTGRSSGPHLHYEIQVMGQPVNPRSYLWD